MESSIRAVLNWLLDIILSPAGLFLLFFLLMSRNGKKQPQPVPEPEETAENEDAGEPADPSEPELILADAEAETGSQEEPPAEEELEYSEAQAPAAGRLGFEIPSLKKSEHRYQLEEVYVETEADDGSTSGGYVGEEQAEAGFEDEWELEQRPRGQEPQRAEEYRQAAEARSKAAHGEHHHRQLEEQEQALPQAKKQLPPVLDGRNALVGAFLSAEIFGPPAAYRRK